MQLSLGDRLVLYSDGVEPALSRDTDGRPQSVERSLARWAGKPRDEMLLELTADIDVIRPDHSEDDITVQCFRRIELRWRSGERRDVQPESLGVSPRDLHP